MSLWSKQSQSGRFCRGKPEVWSRFLPVLDQEVCMANWSLAAGGDWLHYKEATTVSCWCLTCKSCRSKHTLCRGRQHCVRPHWDACITGTYALESNSLRMNCTERRDIWASLFSAVNSMWIWLSSATAFKFLWLEKKVMTLSVRT